MIDTAALARLLLLIAFITVIGALFGHALIGLAVGLGVGLLGQRR